MNEVKLERRSFLKQALAGTIAATALVARGKKGEAKERAGSPVNNVDQRPEEILYRETEAFKKHYDTLYS